MKSETLAELIENMDDCDAQAVRFLALFFHKAMVNPNVSVETIQAWTLRDFDKSIAVHAINLVDSEYEK